MILHVEEDSMLLYQDLFRYAPECYLYTDLNSAIIDANQAAAELLNVPQDFLVGKPLVLFVAAEHRAAFRAELLQLRKSRQNSQGSELQIRLLARDRVVPIDVTLRLGILRNEHHEPIGLCCLIHETLVAAQDCATDEHDVDRAKFLDGISKQLSQSLDYTFRLSSIAHAAVPFLADWCFLNMAEDDGTLRRLAGAHTDPSKQGLLRQLQHQYQVIDRQAEQPAFELEVMHSRHSRLDTMISNRALAASAMDIRYWQLLQGLGFHSQIIVPLTARGQVIGTITLVRGDTRSSFDSRIKPLPVVVV